jgi:hypothetical protein
MYCVVVSKLLPTLTEASNGLSATIYFDCITNSWYLRHDTINTSNPSSFHWYNYSFYSYNGGRETILVISIRIFQHTWVWRWYGQCFLPGVCSVAIICNCHLKCVYSWSTTTHNEVAWVYSIPFCDIRIWKQWALLRNSWLWCIRKTRWKFTNYTIRIMQ